MLPVAQPSGRGDDALPESPRVDEVSERAATVDLDDGQVLAIGGLESAIALDVDDLELELELGLRLAHDLERARAEAAAWRGVDGDLRYGYRPRVVVASATRWTARP